MGVTTAYSSLYNSSGIPIQGRPLSSNLGPNPDGVEITIPTTQLDDAGDVTFLFPVRSGKRIMWFLFDSTDMDSGGGNLDMDLVLRTTSAAGVTTDTILFNAATAFNAALTAKWVWVNVPVPADADNIGHVILYVNVAASTPAQGTLKIYMMVH